MITIHVSKSRLFDQSADCICIPLEQDFEFSKELQALAKKYFPSLKELMHERKFTGKAATTLLLPVSHKDKIINIVFMGMGKPAKKYFSVESYRRMLGRMVRTIEQYKCNSIKEPRSVQKRSEA